MSNQWFYLKNSARFGPVTDTELRHLALSGQIDVSDKIWKEGMQDWANAGNLKGLFKQTPPPLKTPMSPPPLPTQTTGSINNNNDKNQSSIQPPSIPNLVDFEHSAQNEVTSQNTDKQHVNEILTNHGMIIPIGKLKSDSLFDSFDKVSGPLIKPESLEQLKAFVGDQQWEQVLAAGLKPEAINFWCRVHHASIQDSVQNNSQGVSGFFKGMKDRISSTLQQSSVIQSNRFLLITSSKWYLVGQFGFDKQALALDSSNYKLRIASVESRIEIEATSNQNTSQIQAFTVFIDLANDNPSNCNGNLKCLLENWLLEKSRNHRGETLAPPITLAASNPESGTFILPMKKIGPGWLTLRKEKVRFYNDSIELELSHKNIVSWIIKPKSIEIFIYCSNGIQKIEFQSESVSDKDAPLILPANSSVANSNESLVASEEILPIPSMQTSYSAYTYARIIDFFEKEFPSCKCFGESFVAELDARSIFGAIESPTAIIFDARSCNAWIGEGAIRSRKKDDEFRAYELSSGCFLQTGSGNCFRIRMPEDSKPIWRIICQATSPRKSVSDSPGVLAELGGSDDPDFRLVRIDLDQSGSIRLNEGDNEIAAGSVKDIAMESDAWTMFYGSIGFDLVDGKRSKLTASTDTILKLWKGREIYDLNVRTDGVRLGALYEEYNSRRSEKFLTGLFGILVVTQQQLDNDINLDKIKSEINEAPPGPLADELGEKLIQKLSIIEVSRQKISRWFDRCSLFLPHFVSEQEREWLENAFGPKIVDAAKKEKEGRRVQQAIRAELRQVQAALGKPLQELAQNLAQLSFAFPEEVRNPSLAAIRNAASLADKGAMLTAFGGIGAQLLMNVGRASMGDPFAIAMLGSTGLSLVGKHLQQKAREKEQDIKLRGYGMQALQWWDVVLDSAFVMALECHQSLDSLYQAGQDRDRKIMEGLPKDQLPTIQKQMSQAIRLWLMNSVESQFYEVLPGSGMFGHHLVKRITSTFRTRSQKVIRDFGFELPGSSSKEIVQ